MIYGHLLALTIAIVLDYMVGDPPSWPHPVKWFGALISTLDKRLNKGRNRKWKGIFMLMIVLVVVFVPAWFINMAAYQIHPLIGIMVESILISTTIAHKSLKDPPLKVYIPFKKVNKKEPGLNLSI